MPRLFTGLEVSEPVRLALSLLRGGLPGARWIEPEDYHVTLSFIGDVDGALAEDAMAALAEVRAHPLELAVEGLGAFGGEKPRSIIARVRPDAALMQLQAQQEQCLRTVGVEPDRRKFTPHVTLARLRATAPGVVAGYLNGRALPELRFEATRLNVYSSRASKGGGPYVVEAWYPLGD
jgi:2'-5' RNA ligase